jgi:hypothetical protein
MKIFIPKELKGWMKQYKPSEGDLLFVATIAIFAKMYGPKTFLEMEEGDVKSLIFDKPILLGNSHLVRLQKEGVIERITGLDGVESFRFNPKLQVKRPVGNPDDGTITVTLKSQRAIGLCYYLLGRLAYIRVNGTSKEIVIIENKYDAAESKFGIAKAAVNKKMQAKGKVSTARKYVRKKPLADRKRSELNTIPHIYMQQVITKSTFTL